MLLLLLIHVFCSCGVRFLQAKRKAGIEIESGHDWPMPVLPVLGSVGLSGTNKHPNGAKKSPAAAGISQSYPDPKSILCNGREKQETLHKFKPNYKVAGIRDATVSRGGGVGLNKN